ncbi:hypothetical protein JMF97_17865 [Micromonospora fiedleri]|uniref:Thiamine pyrophosphate-binding protein n=1 Tax=Micromonospora fiedleri TaxID=1157498 RepID=A0ABS1UNU7_9ACTN|nr:thiamine pyrophosphate-binding protein [Micromonospora fiedleri]MBL6278026.1 hypothetical protein [Micromonospora fiedleri]
MPDPRLAQTAVPDPYLAETAVPDPYLAETVVARLAAWRVPRVFGIAGEPVAALVEALHSAGGEPEFVPVRHGESAAAMAIGHARLTGGIGVCLSPAGPAAFGLLAGLDAARRATLPVLAIIGGVGGVDEVAGVGGVDEVSGVGGVDQMFAGLCRQVWHLDDLRRAPALVDAAVRGALAGHGPACLLLPGTSGRPPALAEVSAESVAVDPGGPSAGPQVGAGMVFVESTRPLAAPDAGTVFVDSVPPSVVPEVGAAAVFTESGRRSAVAGVDIGLVVDELSARVPPEAAVTVDGAPGLNRHVSRLPPGIAVLACDAHEVSGAALPYAVAVKLVDPQRPVLALLTDDGMRSHGLSELVTIARDWPHWPDPRLVVLVLNTRAGYPGRQVADDVPYAGWARLLGLHGVRVDRPELVGPAWDEALAADRPCLLDLIVTPHPSP